MFLRLLRKERELRVCDERILMYPVTVLMSPRKFSNSEAMLAREMEKSVSEQYANCISLTEAAVPQVLTATADVDMQVAFDNGAALEGLSRVH